MGDIHVKLEDATTEINQAVAQKILAALSKMPGGDTLIQKATADGDITINLGKNLVGVYGGNWDCVDRHINVDIDLPLKTLLKNEEAQDEISITILFELCNAANPLLKPQALKNPLEYPNVEAFVRDSEYAEFKSFQMKATIVNAAIENKIGNWSNADKVPVFEDNEFDKYFKEFPEKVLPRYGEKKTHSNYYRDIYNKTFRLLQDILASALEASYTPSILGKQSVKALISTSPSEQLFPEFKAKISFLLDAKSIKDYEGITKEYKARGLESVDLFDPEHTKFIERGVHQMKSKISMLEYVIGTLNNHLGIIKNQSELLASEKDKIHPNVAKISKLNEVIDALKQTSEQIHEYVQMFQKIKAQEEKHMQYYSALIPEIRNLSSQLVDLKSNEAQMFAEAKKISVLTQCESSLSQEKEDFEKVFGKDSVKINKSTKPKKFR